MTKVRTSRLLVLLSAIALAGGACKREARPQEADARRRAVFVWTAPAPGTVDPALAVDSTSAALALDLFEGLVVAAPGDGPPRAGAARRWRVSEDGLVWTFDLRVARWSDGTPVTAADFVFAWRRVLDPETASPGAEDLWRLEGGRALSEGRGAALGVRALSAQRLELTLARPDPLFLHELASVRWLPVPRQTVESHGVAWTRPEHIVTNGPFRLVRWAPRDRVVLRRVTGFHDAGAIRLDEAVLRVMDDAAAAVRLYEAGAVDYTPGQVPSDTLARLRREGRGDLRVDPLLGTAFLVFNLRRPPFDDVRVRRAFLLAIDRRSLVDDVLSGGQTPLSAFLPPRYAEVAGHTPLAGPGDDPSAARRLLAEAGYAGGAGFPRTVLVHNSSALIARAMARIADDLRRNLGVDVAVESQEWQSYLARLRAGDFDLARFGLLGGVDPLDLLSALRAGAASNVGGYDNPAFDALLDRAREARERTDLLRRAERVLLEDVPVLPLYAYTRPALLRPSVRGFEVQSRGVHLLRYLSIEGGGE